MTGPRSLSVGSSIVHAPKVVVLISKPVRTSLM